MEYFIKKFKTTKSPRFEDLGKIYYGVFAKDSNRTCLLLGLTDYTLVRIELNKCRRQMFAMNEWTLDKDGLIKHNIVPHFSADDQIYMTEYRLLDKEK